MRVPIKWLSRYVPVTLPVETIAERLTMAGLEVTSIDRTGDDWDGVSVGYVEAVAKHPDADRLSLVTVDSGEATFEVVCGAPNVAAGQKIAYAQLGARLIDARSGEKKKLKKAKIRGVVSVGMVCSERELGLSDEHDGILVLDPDAEVGRPLGAVLGDTILDIDMKPNRADGLSVVGVARDVAALTGQTLTEPPLDFEASGGSAEERASVKIEDPELCPRFTLAVIDGIEIRSSPAWMQEILAAAGMRPINNVVDITNFVMLETGQPVHAFDYDKVKDHAIIVRPAREGETLTTLDGKERTFTPDNLLITDPDGPIAVAGVMGGLATEVTEDTKTILLEVANFDPVSIRRTAMALKLPSEASRRFAWGVAPELAPLASRRVSQLLVEHASGRAVEGMVDAYPSPAPPVAVSLPKKRIQQVLGIDPADDVVVGSLEALGFDVETSTAGFEVVVPYWRRDVSGPDDVVEEIARMVGYDAIPAEPLAGSVPAGVPQPIRELRERCRDILVGVGMQEVITYPLTSMAVLETVVSEAELEATPPLAVVNPLNVGEERLRTTLRASLLETLARNQRTAKGPLALFEAARVYTPGPLALPNETEHIVGVVTGRRLDRYGLPLEEALDFFDAKAYPQALFERLSVDASFEPAEEYGLLSGRTASLCLSDGERVGVLGQVHPATAAKFGLSDEVFLFELVVEALADRVPVVASAKAISKYPPVVEDLSLLVDVDQSARSLLAEIEDHPLVGEAKIFDEYTGEQVPAGKRSLAVSIAYQSPDRTLTDRDVSKARAKIVARLAAKCGAELRS